MEGNRSNPDSTVSLEISPDSPLIVLCFILCRSFHRVNQPLDALKVSFPSFLAISIAFYINLGIFPVKLQADTTCIGPDLCQHTQIFLFFSGIVLACQ